MAEILPYMGRYGKTKFPPYQFRAYPKMIYPDGNIKKGIIVNDENEEAKVLGTYKAQAEIKVEAEVAAPKAEPASVAPSPPAEGRPAPRPIRARQRV